MANKQRALIFHEYGGPLTVEKVDIPEPEDDEILIKLHYSGICHSDLHVWLGEINFMTTCPLVGGHEGAGEVVKKGTKVGNEWSIGDFAGIKLMNNHCFQCEYCKSGDEPLCGNTRNYGCTYPGTFQEYVVVRAVDATHVDKEVDLKAAAPTLCAGVTVYKALTVSNTKPGEIVAITGAGGGLGSLAIQYAKAMGFRVLAIDGKHKEEHCKSLGAEWFVDGFDSQNIGENILKMTNGGPHSVINLAAAKKPIEQSIEYIRKRGTVVLVGLPHDSKVTFDIIPFVFKGVTIRGSIVGSRYDVDRAMDFVKRGVVKVPMETVKLEDVASVYERMQNGTLNSRAVIDFSL